MTGITPENQEALRRLALNDEPYIASVLSRYSSVGPADDAEHRQALDDRTKRLVDLAALITVGSGQAGIAAAVTAALGAGASEDDIVETLLSITPAVGSGRVVSCAPLVAAAIGYDLDVEYEELRAG